MFFCQAAGNLQHIDPGLIGKIYELGKEEVKSVDDFYVKSLFDVFPVYQIIGSTLPKICRIICFRTTLE